MTEVEEKQAQCVLTEINRLSKEGVVPINNEHLSTPAILEDALDRWFCEAFTARTRKAPLKLT